VHFLSDLAFCGTSWVSWASGALVTLGDCRHLAAPEFVGSLSGFGDCSYRSIVRGSCAYFPWEIRESNSREIVVQKVLSSVVLTTS